MVRVELYIRVYEMSGKKSHKKLIENSIWLATIDKYLNLGIYEFARIHNKYSESISLLSVW